MICFVQTLARHLVVQRICFSCILFRMQAATRSCSALLMLCCTASHGSVAWQAAQTGVAQEQCSCKTSPHGQRIASNHPTSSQHSRLHGFLGQTHLCQLYHLHQQQYNRCRMSPHPPAGDPSMSTQQALQVRWCCACMVEATQA